MSSHRFAPATATELAKQAQVTRRQRPSVGGLAALLRRAGPGALVVAVFLVAQLVFLMPLIASDQIIYYEAAADFPDVVPDHWQLRIGLLVPVRVTMLLLGQAQAAYYVVPIAAGALLAWSTYRIGALLFDRRVGVAAGLLGSVNSYILLDSSLLPDILATGLLALAIALVLEVCLRRDQGRALGRADLIRLGSAGLLLGWSYLAREFVAFLFVLVPIALAMWRMPWRPALAAVAVPAIAVFAGECVLNAVIHGEPFVRVSATVGHGQGYVDPAIAATFQDQPTLVVLGRLPEALLKDPDGVWTLALLAGLFLAAALRRSRALALLVVWIACFWVPLTLLGGILEPSSPSLRIQKLRYWFPIFPALFVGGTAALALGAAWAVRRRPDLARRRLAPPIALGVAVVIAISVTAVHLSAQPYVFRSTGAVHLDALRRWLERDGSTVKTVWADSRTASMLPIVLAGYFGGPEWKGRIRILSTTQLAALERPARERTAVLVYGGGPEGVPCGFCSAALGKVLGNPARIPANWRLAVTSPDGLLRVYLVR